MRGPRGSFGLTSLVTASACCRVPFGSGGCGMLFSAAEPAVATPSVSARSAVHTGACRLSPTSRRSTKVSVSTFHLTAAQRSYADRARKSCVLSLLYSQRNPDLETHECPLPIIHTHKTNPTATHPHTP